MPESGNDNRLFKIKLTTPVLTRVEKDLETDDETCFNQIDCTTIFALDVKSTSGFYERFARVEKTHDHS